MAEKRICIKDLAPFASAEDLSDERESPLEGDTQKATKLTEITEEKTTPVKVNLSVRNTTPRIDISRASSSSHPEDSSPEREMFSEKGRDTKLEIVFGEEIASELHSSTEELSFYDNTTAPDGDRGFKKKRSSQTTSFPDIVIQNENELRKDSGCSSDIGLLCISSGRTSRVSSVGSVASGGSGVSNLSIATSHCSANSRLSASSNLSRGSSPHRTSVETSFCGPKPVLTQGVSLEDDTTTAAVLDKIRQKLENVSIGARSNDEKGTNCDATEVDNKPAKSKNPSKTTTNSKESHRHSRGSSNGRSKNRRKKPALENPKTQKFVSLHSDEEDESIASRSTATTANVVSVKPSLPSVTTSTTLERTQILIPLKGNGNNEECHDCRTTITDSNTPKRMKPFTNTTLVNFISKYDVSLDDRQWDEAATQTKDEPYIGSKEINKEFQTFIGLKDDDDGKPTSSKVRSNARMCATNGAGGCNSTSTITTTKTITAQYAPNHKIEADGNTSKLASNSFSYHTTTCATVEVANSNSSGGTPLRHCRPTKKYDQDKSAYYDRDDVLNHCQNNTNSLSVNKYDPKSRSDDCDLSSTVQTPRSSAIDKNKMNLQLNFNERPTRSAKSMTQLVSSNRNNKMEYYLSRSTDPSPDGCDGRYLGVDNYTFRRCSESEKEITGDERSKSRSRSGSIKSLFSSFFKKNSIKTSDKKNTTRPNDGDCQVECNEWITGLNKQAKESKSKTVDKEADFIIIPLYSPDNAPALNPPSSTQPISKVDSNSVNNVAPVSGIDNSSKYKKPSNVCETIHSCEVHEDIRRKIEICSPKDDESAKKDETEEIKPDTMESTDKNENYANKVNNDEEYEQKAQLTISRTVDCENIDERIETETRLLKEDETDISSDSGKGTPITAENKEENKKLVNQEESFEELPYVPTTLPLERSVAVPMIPVKERIAEIRTQSIDRPRSSTPSHRGSFDFCVLTITAATKNSNSDLPSSSDEKLHITLPR